MSFWVERRSPAQYEAYWAAVAQPHRQALMRELHLLSSFKSLREVGCAVGTNLRLVRDAFPWVQLSGSDLNEGALEFAKERLPEIEFLCADLMTDSAVWRPGQFDVILSCYALAYLPAEDFYTWATRALRTANKAVIVAEPTGQPEKIGGLHFDEWRHSYEPAFGMTLREIGRKATIRTVGLFEQSVDRCNAVTVVKFTGETK